LNSSIEDTMFKNVANKLAKEKKQDLKIIEWIWPKIEKLLNNNWIYSYKDLANTETYKLRKILENANKRYIILHNPETWNKQAKLAQKWEFNKLKKYQNNLIKWVEK
jgi:predicted flap endonuclease-1-like 5' DNA nuclease